MRINIPAITAILLFASCKSTKDYLQRSNEDKTLYDIVKQLNKHSDDENASKALPVVYAAVQQKYLDKIATFKDYTNQNKWDKIASSYNTLQDMYEAVSKSDAATRLVKAVSYQNQIDSIGQLAAEDYYQTGIDYLQGNKREDAKQAYLAFKKAGSWINNYKNSVALTDSAYKSGIVDIMINPLQDHSSFVQSSWGNNFNSDYLSRNLVNDLGGKNATRYPARFYTEKEAARYDIDPDWLVDLTLREMDIPRPAVYNYTRNVSKKIEVGKDTSGKAIYQTVNATLNIQKQSFTARATIEVNVTEARSRKNILNNNYGDNYEWHQEVATYSGDNRALGSSDWALVNSRYTMPLKEDVMNELYKAIYPQIKNRLSSAASW